MKKRAEMIEKMLGKTVHVIVDRPIGTQHNGITYPINYGYIPELLGEMEKHRMHILWVLQSRLLPLTGR